MANETQTRKKVNKAEKAIKGKAWIISVDMGYGHQRAAYPLKDISFERIITANNDRIISEKEHNTWEKSRRIYEFFSRTRDIPFLGKLTFGLYDQLQKISPFFPFRDLSKPTFSVLKVKSLIKKGLCASLIDYTSKEDIPIVATYFLPALAYDYHGKKCHCVVTDSDINRVWVGDDPKKSRIIYFSPCKHASQRLKEYGVPEERVIETGFPLPKENIGANKEILKRDLAARLANLDPHGVFFGKYKGIIDEKFGLGKNLTFKGLKKMKSHPLTLMYAVGGAGVGKEIGMQLVKSLKKRILDSEIRIVLNGGTKLELMSYFRHEIEAMGLKEQIGKNILILFAVDKKSYFGLMNKLLRETDILWTKPSEMSFYTALGLPKIIAPPVGAH